MTKSITMRVYTKSITLSAEELQALNGAIETSIHNTQLDGCNPERFKVLTGLKKRLASKLMSNESINRILNQ